MSGAFSLTNILADSVGPGTVGLNGDSHYFFLCSSFTTLAFILLHTFWGVIFFKACDNNNYILIGYVVASHLIASGIVCLIHWIQLMIKFNNLFIKWTDILKWGLIIPVICSVRICDHNIDISFGLLFCRWNRSES